MNGGEKVKQVQPIRTPEKVQDVMDALKKSDMRGYILFLTGIHTGLRISDLLTLKVRDVRDRDSIVIVEKKTGKERRFPIHKELKKALKEYISGKEDYEYLFRSRQGKNSPISRMRAYQIIKAVTNKLGIENIGTHSMRKTFGYFLYQQTKNLVAIKEIFNHSDISHTLRYIGVAQETQDKLMCELTFSRRKRDDDE